MKPLQTIETLRTELVEFQSKHADILPNSLKDKLASIHEELDHVSIGLLPHEITELYQTKLLELSRSMGTVIKEKPIKV
ncbi:hypothetical protein [Cnuella takakiae]|uniref:hypothetical protein n=1 Tax=Cnuella takakiae TaxID=1302690 RepID=UPI000979FF71|nr:hypothetical protein [Cnuella takakiae]OLY94253.1 hypothetical protein BUE76_21970 [Cnuella takakiae]